MYNIGKIKAQKGVVIMNRIAVIYCSVHHKNTEKLISYVDTTDNFDLCKSEDIKLGDYDLIGFASGIYMGKLHGKLIRFIKTNQSKLKNIFLVYTSGSKKYGKKIKKELTDLGLSVIDTFSCKGFDTYGPWKLIGGLAKKHPNENDFANYSLFIKNLQIKE